MINSLNHSLRLGATFSYRHSRSWLWGLGTPFSPGVEPDGQARVSVARLVQDYSWRGVRNALAIRSTFNLGVEALNATWHDDQQPDGEFFSWIGQIQYARRLNERGDQLIFRTNVQ